MITEVQKYYSSVLKNIGFAFLAPLGSIVFQLVVFSKGLLVKNVIMGIIFTGIGLLLIYLGSLPITERLDDEY